MLLCPCLEGKSDWSLIACLTYDHPGWVACGITNKAAHLDSRLLAMSAHSGVDSWLLCSPSQGQNMLLPWSLVLLHHGTDPLFHYTPDNCVIVLYHHHHLQHRKIDWLALEACMRLSADDTAGPPHLH